MTEREKVIKRLEYEISRANIPTFGTDFIDCVEVALLRDALALLKAQEPRVMTLEEAQKAEYVYLETRKWVDGDYLGVAKRKNNDFPDYITDFLDGYGCVLSCDNYMYGDNWRCWTSMPTDAQRKATPWES